MTSALYFSKNPYKTIHLLKAMSSRNVSAWSNTLSFVCYKMAKDKNIAGAESVFELLNTHYFGIAYTNRFHNLFNIYIILFFPPLNYYSDSISFISKPLPYPPPPPLPSPCDKYTFPCLQYCSFYRHTLVTSEGFKGVVWHPCARSGCWQQEQIGSQC